VTDDGPGIPAADRERVLGRFVRLDHSRERSSGTTGLGLAIAREIAIAHGGQIVIADILSGGTRVIITLRLEATRRWLATAIRPPRSTTRGNCWICHADIPTGQRDRVTGGGQPLEIGA
jgi:hypothetical protein